MATWIAGTEESTTVSAGGGLPGRGSLPGRGAAAADLKQEPAGEWHAVDADTGRVACGTNRFMNTWPDRSWNEAGVEARCAACAAKVPPA